ERDVQLLYKDLELADNAHGGSIDDHLVIPSAQLLYQFRQAWAFEEFKRVWRNRAGRDHVHSGDVRFADDLIHSQLTYQVSAEAVAQLQAQPLMHLWPPHIRIHKQRALVSQGHYRGQVHRAKGLPFAAGAAGDAHHLPGHICIEVLQVDAGSPETFGQDGPVILILDPLFLGDRDGAEHRDRAQSL